MNRRTILIASALFVTAGASTAFAQDMVPHPSFGILAGVDFAKLHGDNTENVSSRTGFVGGVSMNLHFARHIGVEVDGLYSQEGAKVGESESGDVKLKLDYIRLPVLLRFGIPTHSSVHPFVVVGPSLGFKISCKEANDTDSVNCDDISGDNGVKSFDFAGLVGAGVGFRVGKEEVSLQGRYTYGFTDIVKDSKTKNSNFAVLAGFAF